MVTNFAHRILAVTRSIKSSKTVQDSLSDIDDTDIDETAKLSKQTKAVTGRPVLSVEELGDINNQAGTASFSWDGDAYKAKRVGTSWYIESKEEDKKAGPDDNGFEKKEENQANKDDAPKTIKSSRIKANFNGVWLTLVSQAKRRDPEVNIGEEEHTIKFVGRVDLTDYIIILSNNGLRLRRAPGQDGKLGGNYNRWYIAPAGERVLFLVTKDNVIKTLELYIAEE